MLSDYVVLYAPGLAEMAADVAGKCGARHVMCCSEVGVGTEPDALYWQHFPSSDPDLKLRIDVVRDAHVVFLMSHERELFFEQHALISFLQRFNVPRPLPEYAKGKWKESLADGEVDECSVASLTIVIPWYRHCQMERVSRWAVANGKWYNGKADGEFVDVPTAQAFAALLSAAPMPGKATPPPLQLLLLDIHEYIDLENTLNATRRWANRKVKYDFALGSGTYFASPLRHFLSSVLCPLLTDVTTAFVVFPDHGAHRRFSTMVELHMPGIPKTNILWITKSRVGAAVSQADGFNYADAEGKTHVLSDSFPDGASVLIADDFTNSGSTLFGGAAIIRRHSTGSLRVRAYVTHFVAQYAKAKIDKFIDTLYADDAALDEFHCSDTVCGIVSELTKQSAARVASGQPQKVFVTPVAPIVSDWIAANPPPSPSSEGCEQATSRLQAAVLS
uniref:Ribose-phosphate pyrophosphokinase N-terminal domain-containing protein n=1 Tax=Coccolithus braarudii TaxID=221442 RepID=A0A7S0PYE9_9EUKA